MNIFDIFSRNRSKSAGLDNEINKETPSPALVSDANEKNAWNDEKEGDNTVNPEIPEHVFVEYDKPKTIAAMEPNDAPLQRHDLQMLYSYLEKNLEKKGYEDALMNPDTSCRDEHIRFIQNELNLMISRVRTYYNSYMRTIDLHIDTRKRGGMLELVDELVATRDTVTDELKIVGQIEHDSQNGNGLTENLFLGYKKGFKNGFAAITYNTVIKRP